jgi:hypothetical protein
MVICVFLKLLNFQDDKLDEIFKKYKCSLSKELKHDIMNWSTEYAAAASKQTFEKHSNNSASEPQEAG